VYVLDPRIQDGKKLPHWSPRSRRGQYVGYLPEHASTVPLVLNLTTHCISTQFHVVFDDWFTTVDLDPNEALEFDDPQWEDLLENKYFHDTDPDDGDPPQLHTEYHEEHNGPMKEQGDQLVQKKEGIPKTAPDPTLAPIEPLTQAVGDPYEAQDIPDMTHYDAPADNETGVSDSINQQSLETLEPVPAPRSPPQEQRESQPKNGYGEQRELRRSQQSTKGMFQSTRFQDEEFSLLWSSLDTSEQANGFIVECLTAATTDPDTLGYEQAMKADDANLFRESAQQELRDLMEARTWKVVDKSQAQTRILPGIWVFRRK
jgi:hypothetical protein